MPQGRTAQEVIAIIATPAALKPTQTSSLNPPWKCRFEKPLNKELREPVVAPFYIHTRPQTI